MTTEKDAENMPQGTPNTDVEILVHRFDELPEHVRYHAKRGFGTLRSVSEEAFAQFKAAYLDAVANGEVLDAETVDKILQVDERISSDAVLATSISMGAVADLSVGTEDFVEAGRCKIF